MAIPMCTYSLRLILFEILFQQLLLMFHHIHGMAITLSAAAWNPLQALVLITDALTSGDMQVTLHISVITYTCIILHILLALQQQRHLLNSIIYHNRCFPEQSSEKLLGALRTRRGNIISCWSGPMNWLLLFFSATWKYEKDTLPAKRSE